jgi:hypothetical protein
MKMKMKVKHIDSDLTAILNVWQMIAYIFRYCKMELFIFMLLVILGTMAIMNLNYNEKYGWQYKPGIKVDINKEVKK